MNKHLLQRQQFQRNQSIQNNNKQKKYDASTLTKFFLNKQHNLKIAFWDNSLCERGTTVALYDYAYYNKKLLNNQSIILYNNTKIENNQNVIDKFKREFDVFSVSNFNEVDTILKEQQCDIFYIIKAGSYDNQVSNIIKTVVHCVFNCDEEHGNVYASIAPWVKNNNGRYPFVPHIMSLPYSNENMRQELNIPQDAIVYARYGGYNQFDLTYVHKTIYNVAQKYPNKIYFLFANTKKFCDNLPNIIHLDPIIDLDKKVKFINTSDAMIWARSEGEIFSCSMGEFAIKNKPIICTKINIGDLGHVHLLKDQAIWYNENNLENILITFNKEENEKLDWNAYKEYTPENVMQIFKKVFIDNFSSNYDVDYIETYNESKTLYIYFNAFWPDCQTDQSYYQIFINLFSKVYNCKIEISTFESSDILIESIWGQSKLTEKKWKYSYFYSGEPESNEPLNVHMRNYTALLKNSRTHKNIIHFPFFSYYQMYSSFDFKKLEQTKQNIIPKKFCATFISNPNGTIRNKFIEKLEKYKNIDHYGKYKNNQSASFAGNWHSKELIEKMKEYKFIICFENSENFNCDSYITEKIINPLLANVIPIYWGNKRIGEYFNIDRILNLKTDNELDIDNLIQKIIDIDSDSTNQKYLSILKEPYQDITNVHINESTIVNDIRRLLFNKLSNIQKVTCIVNKEIESDRYIRINEELKKNGIQNFMIEHLLPTYYNTLENLKLYNKIKVDNSKYLQTNEKNISLREISIFLNFYIIFKKILGYYKEGLFMILESDIICKENFNLIYKLLSSLDLTFNDCISFGSGCNIDIINNNNTENNIELYKNPETRCMDSLIFSIQGIQKFVDYIESKIFTTGIDNPIDYFMNDFLKETNSFNMYWTSPSLTIQGSQNGTFQSNIQS
jgi:hypothetical protein